MDIGKSIVLEDGESGIQTIKGQKQFLLAPIEPNTNTIHFHDDNDSLKVPINITSIDTIDDVVGGKKNLYAWSDQVERS